MNRSLNFWNLLPLQNDLDPNSTDVPLAIRSSVDRLRDTGVYLLENGNMMFLWIGLHVSNDWVQDVFGVHSPAQIDIDSSKLLNVDNPTSLRVRKLVETLRKGRPRYMKVSLNFSRYAQTKFLNSFLNSQN